MINQRGQTLIEALIGLAVAIVIISAIVIAVISSLSNAQFTKNQNQANHYAQEGMEIVRQIRNSSWIAFTSFSSTFYCLDANSKTLTTRGASGCGQNVGIYVREIDVEHDSPFCVGTSRVAAKVSWSDAKCTDSNNTFCHNVSLISCFGNNNAVPTP
ncbi:MAG: hypothetical protein WD992_02210 [Candidatus Levyibacteriota bacterium]